MNHLRFEQPIAVSVLYTPLHHHHEVRTTINPNIEQTLLGRRSPRSPPRIFTRIVTYSVAVWRVVSGVVDVHTCGVGCWLLEQWSWIYEPQLLSGALDYFYGDLLPLQILLNQRQPVCLRLSGEDESARCCWLALLLHLLLQILKTFHKSPLLPLLLLDVGCCCCSSSLSVW